MRWLRAIVLIVVGFGTMPVLSGLSLVLNPKYSWLGWLPLVGGVGILMAGLALAKGMGNTPLRMWIWILSLFFACSAPFFAILDISWSDGHRSYISTVNVANGYDYVFYRTDFKDPWLHVSRPTSSGIFIENSLNLRHPFPGPSVNPDWEKIEVRVIEEKKLIAVYSGGIVVDVLTYNTSGALSYATNIDVEPSDRSPEANQRLEEYFERMAQAEAE